MNSQKSHKHTSGTRAFFEDHEDAIWAVVLGLGLLLMSLYTG